MVCCTELGVVALQGGPCRATVYKSLFYYLGPHHPGFKGKQACLRAVVQLPLVALEAHPLVDDVIQRENGNDTKILGTSDISKERKKKEK